MAEVQVLGPLAVDRGGETRAVAAPSQRILLAVLAAEWPRTVPRRRLIDALWDDPPPSAEGSLQSHVSRLRRLLGPAAIETDGPGYRLTVPVDAERFARVVEDTAGSDAVAIAEQLDDALAMWRGPAFGELGGHPFLIGSRRRLDALRTEARLRRARAHLLSGAVSTAVAALESLTADEPLHEGAWALLIEALAAADRQADALRAAQAARSRLAEVGLEGSDVLRVAEQRALDSAAGGAGGGRGNLPRPASRFVGRTGEIDALMALLRTGRCVTLVGPGGVGKTRLAVETAARMPAAEHGTWFCDLAAVTSGDDVPAAVATTLGASLTPPVTERVARFCADRALVLVLDNCEHVLDAVASLAGTVVASCPQVTLLATSRVRLGIDGERVVDVEPLSIDGDAVALFLDRADVAGAELTGADHAAVAEICRRLDGLPLAIEMAAVRSRAISPRQLAERLDRRFELLEDDRRPPRHRTLREIVAWSYEALAEAERTAFVRSAAFISDFALDAAEEVLAADPLATEEVAAALARLADRSLLVVTRPEGEPRFRMLETTREFASAVLDASSEQPATLVRHAAHYARLAGELDDGLRGPDEAAWARRVERETPNLRAAHRTAVERGLVDEAAAIPARLFHYVSERRRADIAGWAVESLSVPGVEDHPLAPVLWAVAALGEIQADRLDTAETMARRGVEAAGGSSAARFPRVALSDVLLFRGDLAGAEREAVAARGESEAAGDRFMVAFTAMLRVVALGYQGERDAALAALAEQRRLAADVGAPALLAYADYAEGEVLIDVDPERAAALFDSAAATARAHGCAFAEGAARLSATTVRARGGDPEEALSAFGPMVRHWLERGDWMHVWMTLRNLVVLLVRVGSYRDAAVVHGAVGERAGGAFGAEAQRLAAVQRELEERLGAAALHEALGEGRRMPPEDAVRFALERITAAAG